MVNKSHLIDNMTFSFVPFSRRTNPFEVYIPAFYWEYPEGRQHIEYISRAGQVIQNVYTRTDSLYLNQLEVVLQLGYKNAQIAFKNEAVGGYTVIRIDAFPRPSYVHKAGQSRNTVGSIDYRVIIDGVQKDYKSTIRHMEIGSTTVPALTRIIGSGDDWFVFGISPHPHEVKYRGRLLDGRSYALICGPWAILLTDDLRFDSLACLSLVQDRKLYVDRFLYTVNPYITKSILLVG